MGVENTDLAKQLEAKTLGARLWRLHPGQASTRHRHRRQHELYVVLKGSGRIRVDDKVLTLEPLSALLVEPTPSGRSSTTAAQTPSGSSSARPPSPLTPWR